MIIQGLHCKNNQISKWANRIIGISLHLPGKINCSQALEKAISINLSEVKAFLQSKPTVHIVDKSVWAGLRPLNQEREAAFKSSGICLLGNLRWGWEAGGEEDTEGNGSACTETCSKNHPFYGCTITSLSVIFISILSASSFAYYNFSWLEERVLEQGIQMKDALVCI